MKKILFILLVFFSVESLQGQEDIKKVNFIITVDDKIVEIEIWNSKIFIRNGNKTDTISCQYLPGELTIYDYSKLVSADTNMVVLSMTYAPFVKKEFKYYYYEIELNKNLFNSHYVILHIYNLDKWKYRRIYYPLDGKNYTYEFDLPGYSIVRIRKR